MNDDDLTELHPDDFDPPAPCVHCGRPEHTLAPVRAGLPTLGCECSHFETVADVLASRDAALVRVAVLEAGVERFAEGLNRMTAPLLELASQFVSDDDTEKPWRYKESLDGDDIQGRGISSFQLRELNGHTRLYVYYEGTEERSVVDLLDASLCIVEAPSENVVPHFTGSADDIGGAVWASLNS